MYFFLTLLLEFHFAFTEAFRLSEVETQLNRNDIITLAKECFLSSNCLEMEYEKCFISSWQIAVNNLLTFEALNNSTNVVFNNTHFDTTIIHHSQAELINHHPDDKLTSFQINEMEVKDFESFRHRDEVRESSDGSYTCDPYTASDTDSALQNFVTCSISACPGSTITASVCASFTGDTYLRLYDGDTQVEESDDDCGRGSAITYSVSGSVCRDFSLQQGCYGSNSCSGTSEITVVTLIPSPTFQRTERPTSQPTISPAPTGTPTQDIDHASLLTFSQTDLPIVTSTTTRFSNWFYQGGTSGGDRPYSISLSPDGLYVYITGYIGGSLYATFKGSQDIIIEKRNGLTGSLIWGNQYGTNTVEFAYSVAVSPDGGYVCITGLTAGSLYATSKGNTDIILECRDALTGSLIWGLQYGTTSADNAYSVAVSPDGAFVYITGSTGGSLYATSKGSQDIIIEKRSALTGALEVGLQYGTSGSDDGRAVSVQLGGSTLLVKGRSVGGALFATGSGEYFEATHNASDLTVISGFMMTAVVNSGGPTSVTTSGVWYECGSTTSSLYSTNQGSSDYWVRRQCADATHYFQTSSSCSACPANTVSPTSDDSACTCSASYYNPDGGAGASSDLCVYCPPPSLTSDDKMSCLVSAVTTSSPTMLPSNNPALVPIATPTGIPTASSQPTVRPTSQATVSSTSSPTETSNVVHVNPSSLPTNRPTVSSTTTPSVSDSSACLPFSTSDTNSALQNFVTCSISACPGSTITASVCASYTGDTYLRLYDGDTQVEENDDDCGRGSALTYSVSGSVCRDFSLRQGCYDSNSCSGTSEITVVTLTPSPTFQLTERPTSQSTISPAPTVTPTSLPTETPDVVLLDDVTDSHANGIAASCRLNHISGSCNLRSAVEYCVSESSSSYCEIHLPVGGAVVLNSQWPHMRVTGRIQPGPGFLTIVGHGSTLTRAGSQSARVMEVDVTNEAESFSLELLDLTVQEFSGAFYLSGLQSFKCTRVTFLYNYAHGGQSWTYNKDGGALYVKGLKSVVVMDSVFSDNFAYSNGGAIYLDTVTGSVQILGSTFKSNTVYTNGGAVYLTSASYLTVTNCTVISNSARYGDGGGVYLRNSDRAIITGAIFRGNRASFGGGFHMISSNYVTMSNSLLDGNIADEGYNGHGGALFLNQNRYLTMSGCKVTNNKAQYGGGGFIDRNNDHLTIINTIFDNNEAFGMVESNYRTDGGGALVVLLIHYLTITDCKVTNNRAADGGGGIFFYSDEISQYITITNTLFRNNSASTGGALYLSTHSHLEITNCDIMYNHALSDGGGIKFDSIASVVLIASSKFSHNSAVSGGGVFLSSLNSDFNIENSYFDNNEAEYGAGIYLRKLNTINISNSVFLQNLGSVKGGGMYFDYDNDDCVVRNVSFVANMSPEGAGVYSYSNSRLQIVDSLFKNNNASFYGGGVFFDSRNNNFKISRSKFENNFAIMLGGGIYLFSSNECVDTNSAAISWSFFSNNFCSVTGGGAIASMFQNKFQIANSEFINNSAYEGGAIFSYFKNDLYFSHLRVSLNRASNGGAISVGQQETVSISDCNITFNSAENNGGGIAVSLLSTLHIHHSNFNNNQAEYSGGAIHTLMKNNLVCSHLHVESNVARYGGGISIGLQESIVIQKSKITSNIALEDGGGIAVSTLSVLNVSYTSLTENLAELLGGAIYYESDDLHISHSHVSSNVAGQGGGGVYVVGDSIVIADSTLAANSVTGLSGNGGAVLFASSRSISLIRNKVANNFVFNKGALMFDSCKNVVMKKNEIFSNRAASGGGVAMEKSVNFHFKENIFDSNLGSDRGGGVSVQECSDISVAGDVLTNNTAGGANGGAAIWVTGSELRFDNSTLFMKNKALNGGGTVLWVFASNMSEPAGMLSSMFVDNEALYGSLWATESMHFQVDSSTASGNSAKSSSADKFEVSTYQQSYQMGVFARDFYQQLVLSNSHTLVKVDLSSASTQHCGARQPSLTGESLLQMFEGISLFKQTFVSCMPGGNMTLVFKDADSGSVLSSNEITLKFRKCVTGEYYRDGECRMCENGFYSKTPNEDLQVTECKKCPVEAETCEGSDIVLSPGFWSINDNSDSLSACPMGAAACPGGVAAKTDTSIVTETDTYSRVTAAVDVRNLAASSNSSGCHVGYYGPLCAICEEGFYYESTLNTCSICQPGGLSVVVIVILIVILLYPIVLLIKKILNRLGVKMGDSVYFEAEDFMTTILFHISIKLTKYKINVQKLARSFQRKLFLKCERASLKFNSKFKIFISMFQIVSTMKTVLDMNFPSKFARITSFLNVFNLGSFGLSCSVSFDFVDYLLFVTVIPGFIILILVLLHQRYTFEDFFRGVSVDDHIRSAWQSKFYFYLLFFLFLILPSVSSTIFRTFSCENVDPGGTGVGSDFYLRADYTIACDSDRYHFGMLWAIACVFLYPIGVPLFYYKVLHDHRDHIINRNIPYLVRTDSGEPIADHTFADGFKIEEDKTKFREDALHSVRFLYYQYEPQFWYWEVIETVRKIMLTGALVLVGQGSVLQVVVGFMICLVFIKLYTFFAPYEDDDADISAESAQWQVLLFFFIALLIKDETFSHNKMGALDAALLTVVVFGILVECVTLFIRMREEDETEAEESLEELLVKNNAELLNEVDEVNQKAYMVKNDSFTLEMKQMDQELPTSFPSNKIFPTDLDLVEGVIEL